MNVFLQPMLASPLPASFDPAHGEWVAEEKYDGHRLLVRVSLGHSNNISVVAWSRNGLERALPAHLRKALAELPSGLYDGELIVPGTRSYGVVVLENAARLVYTIFDVLELLDRDITGFPLRDRRAFLEEMKSHLPEGVSLAPQWPLLGVHDIAQLSHQVWARDGEGLIIKALSSKYLPGKRSREWLKVKQLRVASMTVIGFIAGRLGPYATVFLQDDEGNHTKVKTKDNASLARFDVEGADKFIGRRLLVEYQERTPDGGYRHPRWDRWEDE